MVGLSFSSGSDLVVPWYRSESFSHVKEKRAWFGETGSINVLAVMMQQLVVDLVSTYVIARYQHISCANSILTTHTRT
jgi:hypothetical protein